MRSILTALLAMAVPASAGVFQFVYDNSARVWSLSNDVATAQFELNSLNQFRLRSFALANGQSSWKTDTPHPSSPIRFTFDKIAYGASTKWTLVSQAVDCPSESACTQIIDLRDNNGAVRIELKLWMYAGQPVLRHHIRVTNLKSAPGFVTLADMLPYTFTDASTLNYRLFRVNQWAVAPKQTDFETFQSVLRPNGAPINILSGSHGVQCAWLALRDASDRGLFAGWEFDGLANASARYYANGNYLQLASPVSDLHHPIQPGSSFSIPSAFIGIYQGDWDEAGYRTQRFVEAALGKAVPEPDKFPYIVWDSWAYQTDFNEDILRQEAVRAAQLGIELFIVDLGWAQRLGDWTEDPAKFPNGLLAVSDYVHSLGMKFGLHFAFAEADPQSAVILQNPDWTSTESDNYYGGLSLCLSNKPAHDWIVSQAIRMIDDYQVDWILQDGENMVKRCTKTNHTHDPGDSNYANAVNGVNAVIAEVQAQRPNVLWENCENGGNMMTFNMVKFYVTSITNDASGALPSRQAVYGATYPFPTRYTDRYQPEDFTDTYTTRSYMFGGPWHLMNKLVTMPQNEFQLALSEVATYKEIRSAIRDGKVFHLTSPAAPGATDAIQSYDPATDSAITIVCRDGGTSDTSRVRLRGLKPDANYEVTFQDDPRILAMTGAQLMDAGVDVQLPARQDAEIVYVQPLGGPNSRGHRGAPRTGSGKTVR